jgi:hypothetical protein
MKEDTSFNRVQNKTSIYVKEKDKKMEKQTLKGLVIIKLNTRSGSLGWEF